MNFKSAEKAVERFREIASNPNMFGVYYDDGTNKEVNIDKMTTEQIINEPIKIRGYYSYFIEEVEMQFEDE
jgi:hypothetical protein